MNEARATAVISLDSWFHLTSMQVCLIQGNTRNVHGVTGGDTKHKLDGISAASNTVQKKGRKCYQFLCKHTHTKIKRNLFPHAKSPECCILCNTRARIIKLMTMTTVSSLSLLLRKVMLLRKERGTFSFGSLLSQQSQWSAMCLCAVVKKSLPFKIMSKPIINDRRCS